MTVDTRAAERSQMGLVAALADPACYPHAVAGVEMIETHISYVLLAGDFAYKIKKPVNLGFLDFSTLARRRHFCEEEVRLNQRLAPSLYLGVVAIAGRPQGPRIDGDGPAIEYAVKMRRFAQDGLLDRCLAEGRVPPEVIDRLADAVAEFHGQAARAAADGGFGTPEAVWAPMAENFAQLRARMPAAGGQLAALEAWSRQRHAQLGGLLDLRRRNGFVRECHGDLHLGNIALVDGCLQIFDCIEFSPALRWIDVISEIAFLTMDLAERGRPDYGRRLLNRYLEGTGDYGGLPLLAFYQVYRALVRAKVAAIRAGQAGAGQADGEPYLAFAARAARPGQPRLVLMHGLAGSGKTWLSQVVLERLGAIRLRSDVERKRLHGLSPLTRTAAGLDAGIYAASATRATYDRLADLTVKVLGAGYPVVVDAASLLAGQRGVFRRLAAELRVPFAIVDCVAPESVLLARIAARRAEGRDASEADAAVLAHQRQRYEALADAELPYRIVVDTGGAVPEDWPARLRDAPVPALSDCLRETDHDACC